MTQLWLSSPPTWHRIDKFLPKYLIDFVCDHYSRQTPDSNQILGPGETLLMTTEDDHAIWGVVHNYDPGQDDTRRWRNTIFRRGGGLRASDLIIEATAHTLAYWPRKYGHTPDVPLTSEVNAAKVRHKRDPGRCFRKAGWELWSRARLLVFIAPGERARLGIQGPVLR